MKTFAAIHESRCAFMNLKLNQKLAVGYFFIVFVPVISFSLLLFSINYYTTKQSYLQSQKQELSNFNSQLNALLNQLSNYSYFFQNNTEIITYLDSRYATVSDIMFHYIDSMSSTFDCYAYDSRVSSITLYGTGEYVMTLPGKLETMEHFTEETQVLTLENSLNGIWKWTSDDNLTFYKTLYNKNYRSSLGILQLKANLEEILRQLTTGLEHTWYFCRESDTPSYYYYDGNTLNICNSKEITTLSQNSSILKIKLDSIPCTIIQPVTQNILSKVHIPLYLLVATSSLLLFSIMYYLIAGSLTRRLVDFNHFVSNQEAHYLATYPGTPFEDEIGSTIATYNRLILKINELIHNNYEVSLKMKEAQYYALQAQIKPHFLYNILENIRMSSEQHNDSETAHMTTVFGKYMRYAMNTSTANAPLETELQSARDYLEVNQIRMDKNLIFNISIETEPDQLFCPRFILQPLLENCLGHGLRKGAPLHIHIRIFETDTFSDEAYVSIADDGAGIEYGHLQIIQQILYSDTTFPASRHVGLRNVNDRLKASHPKGKGLTIESSINKGTVICFPLARKGALYENIDCR